MTGDSVKRKIVVLTPVKNEAWILPLFLRAASVFADHIILLDQQSADQSVKIAKQFSKVMVISNPSKAFNERERQNLLLAEARKLAPGAIFIALDADEIPTPEICEPGFLEYLRNLPPGSALQADWLNLAPDLKSGWPSPMTPFAYSDDGAPHEDGTLIHRPRLPITQQTFVERVDQLRILHYQYVDPARRASKKRWYQMWEYLEFPEKSPLEIFRTYNHATGEGLVRSIPESIKSGWKSRGVDLTSFDTNLQAYYWDDLVGQYFSQYGAKYFSGIYLGDRSEWDLEIIRTHTYLQKVATRYASASKRILVLTNAKKLKALVHVVDIFVSKIWRRS